MWAWFKSLPTAWKLTAIVIIISLLAIVFLSIQNRIYLNRLEKYIKSDIETINKKLEASDEKTNSTIKSGKKNNTDALNKNKAIDKKLQDDKTKIDNSSYPDAKLDSLLSRYGN